VRRSPGISLSLLRRTDDILDTCLDTLATALKLSRVNNCDVFEMLAMACEPLCLTEISNHLYSTSKCDADVAACILLKREIKRYQVLDLGPVRISNPLH